jgi:hypothetical protein
VDVISGGPGVDAIIALGGNDNITKDNFGTVNIADNSTDNVRCGGRTRHIYIAPKEMTPSIMSVRRLSYGLSFNLPSVNVKSNNLVHDNYVSISCKSCCKIPGSP